MTDAAPRAILRKIAVPWLAEPLDADRLIDTILAFWRLRDAAHLLRLVDTMEARPAFRHVVLGWLFISAKMATSRDGYTLLALGARYAAVTWPGVDPTDRGPGWIN